MSDRVSRLKLSERHDNGLDSSGDRNSLLRTSTHSDDNETNDWQKLVQSLQPLMNARCSIQRRKTTLWTTYHLCVDAVDGTEIDVESSTTCAVVDSIQIRPGKLQLCARRVKNSMSGSQYLVWLASSGGLSKGKEDWKEKLAVGRLQRVGTGAGVIYMGRLTPEAAAFLEQGSFVGSTGTWDGTATHVSDHADCRRGAVCVSVMSGGLDRLNHVAAVAALDTPWRGETSDDGHAAVDHKNLDGTGDNADEEMMGVLMVSVILLCHNSVNLCHLFFQ